MSPPAFTLARAAKAAIAAPWSVRRRGGGIGIGIGSGGGGGGGGPCCSVPSAALIAFFPRGSRSTHATASAEATVDAAAQAFGRHASADPARQQQKQQQEEEEQQQQQQKQQQNEEAGSQSAAGTAAPNRSRLRRLIFTGLFFGAAVGAGAPRADNVEDAGLSPVDFARRARGRWAGFWDGYAAPAYESLLPDALPAPYQRPYTLVVNLDDTLVRSWWDPQHGWRIARHPQAARFLGYLSQYYEVVVFTSAPGRSAAPVIDQVDSLAGVMYRLYREATTYKAGVHVKDVTNLNRDPARILVLDVSPQQYPDSRANVIMLPRWDGNPGNSTLLDHVPFLETLALSNVPDVRPVLKAYKDTGLPIPVAFQERRRRFRNGGSPPATAAAAATAGASPSSSSSLLQGGVGGEGAPVTKSRGWGLRSLIGLGAPGAGMRDQSSGGSSASDIEAGGDTNVDKMLPGGKLHSQGGGGGGADGAEGVGMGARTTSAAGTPQPLAADALSAHMERTQRRFVREEAQMRAEAEMLRKEQEREMQRVLDTMKSEMSLWEFWGIMAKQIMGGANSSGDAGGISPLANPSA